ncbi:MAG: hypothetical protein K6F87_02420 [Lachnospiraceae bacterium]|nr:hypothetical protein [Lachnospiraceae bacterium]
MLFNSISFIILFPLTVLVYFLIPKRFRFVWLLVVSYAFYFAQSKSFVLLLVASTLITYVTGIALAAFDGKTVKKLLVACSATLQLSTLFVFKYLDLTLELCGSGLRFNLMLPLGISFYTFQAVSYIVDVYKDPEKCEGNILKLALYLSFFLSIVSGPINRAGDILPQLSPARDMSYEDTKRGMQKMLWGYFLKLAVAGRLSIVVDNVYGSADSYSGFSILCAALAYMFMLYCDFEGYSQIAIGSGYILGIRMKENFRQPFYSENMSQMWRRWHISLSTWFRDYLYIPLGGNRLGKARKYVNLFVVLFVSGIWHGANLTFFVWGAINGAYVVIGQITTPAREKIASFIKDKIPNTQKAKETFDRVRTALKRIGSFLLFAFVFIFFANDSLASSCTVIRSIFTRLSLADIPGDIVSLGLGSFNLCLTLLMIAFVLVADGAANKRQCDTPALALKIPTALRWTIYYALIILILFSANLTGKEFIYANM